jgi:hypothetical protein
MDTLDQYRSVIKNLLSQYYEVAISHPHGQNSSELSDRLAFDELRDQYLWIRFGWDDKKLVQHIILYLCIKDGKIWVEQDSTDLCIVDALLDAGIPPSEIVLGFHHPRKRMLTEFAPA